MKTRYIPLVVALLLAGLACNASPEVFSATLQAIEGTPTAEPKDIPQRKRSHLTPCQRIL